jgi:predicted metal-dependent HD superfamily phosphohydrolase
MDERLAGAWERDVAPLGADPALSRAARDDLERRHAEPHRAYHTLAHVAQVLAGVDELIAAGEPVADPGAVRLAAWFHDAVYVPGSPDNERASAELADVTLDSLGLAADRRGRVRALVLATRDHTALDADADTRVLVDADLAVLAAPDPAYAAYVRAVRREYAAVPESAWRTGRGAFLAGMLARDAVFTTATMRVRAEPAARRNLAGELATLRGAAP